MPVPVKGYAFRACRLMSHSWHEVDSNHWTMNPQYQRFAVPMTLRCERCDMERRDVIDKSTADVLSRRYVAPLGYHWDGEEKPTRQDFRMGWLTDHVAAIREERRERRDKMMKRDET